MAILTNPNPNSPPINSQIFVKLLNGKTLTLNFTAADSPITTSAVKRRIHNHTKIPTNLQRLILGPRQLHDDGADSIIATPQCTITLTLPLVGGKGGFGSLLRGAATKAGQKKTNNFDACRDMSGRRLRHVNAEKRLEEWKEEEEERKLEKVADEWLKKMAKKGKKEGGARGDREAEKYVEKYREVSARCVADVEESVREAVKAELGKKREKKGADDGCVNVPDKKKLKIWMGKRKIGESYSDSSDDDSSDEEDDNDEEHEKSIVVNSGSNSDSSKEAEGSSGSVAGEKQGGEFPGSSSEEEKETVVQGNLNPVTTTGEDIVQQEENGKNDPVICEDGVVSITDVGIMGIAAVPGTEATEMVNEYKETESGNPENTVGQRPSVISSANGKAMDIVQGDVEANSSADSKSFGTEGTTFGSCSTAELEKPINLEEFNSAGDLEVLGMERLKSELQSRGLKCGGTLQERAARLFLLKSTPLEKLPKKLLAKK